MTEWWEDGDEVVVLARYLVDADWFRGPSEVVDYFAQPWKYAHERAHLVEGENVGVVAKCELCESEVV